jgi:hypothetical protein
MSTITAKELIDKLTAMDKELSKIPVIRVSPLVRPGQIIKIAAGFSMFSPFDIDRNREVWYVNKDDYEKANERV